MKFSSKKTNITELKTGCLIVSVDKQQKLSPSAAALDKASKGALKKILERGDLKEGPGSVLMLSSLPGMQADRVLLVRAGDKVDSQTYIDIVTAAFTSLLSMHAKTATSYLEEIDVLDRDIFWRTLQSLYACHHAHYQFNAFRSEKNIPALTTLTFNATSKDDAEMIGGAVEFGSAITTGMTLTKDLGHTPSNICTPAYLAQTAKKIAATHPSVKTTVLDEPDLKKLKMGGLLAVGQGSAHRPKLITLEYQGGKTGDKPIVLVGKGITFDSGGISIKPSKGMEEMKFDMLGSATVLGVITACAEFGLPINVTGIIPTAENMPSSTAYKPGDIITTMAGKTVEIVNTDAEGRMILCDALTFAAKFKPKVVIDMATLTGAVIVALGHEATAVVGNNQALVDDLLAASRESHDLAWQLPLWKMYRKHLKSDCADFTNCGDRSAGTLTAAAFLSYFTEDYEWAHLDIAGSSWVTTHAKIPTGRPVPLLMEYLLSRCEQ